MAKAKKLPSGNWRCRVFSHTDATGKHHYESFTASTRQEAELMAARFKASHDRRLRNDVTVAEAIDGYITAKTGVLSPSTIRAYRQMERTKYDTIGHVKVRRLRTEDVQTLISHLSKEVSPKTVHNAHVLLVSAVAMYAPDATFKVTLPKKVNRRRTAPSDDLVAELFKASKGQLRKAIALAAFGSLRRGEICALTYADLNGDTISITKDIVHDENNKWVLKDMPKTSDSVRDVRLPEAVIALLGDGEPTERIVPVMPSTITHDFLNLRKRLGVNIRFHDLRHYFASIGAALNIPDTYLSSFGGWRQGSSVLKTVYQNQITPISDAYAKKMTDHFDGLLRQNVT